MSLSDKPSAYGPILRALLNKAVSATAGISLEVKSESEAIQTRQRLYKVRELENRTIRKNFGAEYAGPWDPIRILVEKSEQGTWHVILTKDEILLGQVKVTDLASGQELGVAGDLLSKDLPTAVSPSMKDPFAEEE